MYFGSYVHRLHVGINLSCFPNELNYLFRSSPLYRYSNAFSLIHIALQAFFNLLLWFCAFVFDVNF